MKKQKIKFFQAIAVMIGYIIGVGMFGLPYLVAKAGILPFLFFLIILIPAQYLLHLIYASMIINTRTYHRLPGYTEIYIGKGAKALVFLAKMVGNFGALLAYIIITGIFLNNLLQPLLGGNEFIYATALFLLEAIIVYFGIGMIAKAELFMTALLLLVVGLIVYKGLGIAHVENYIAMDWKYFVLPYGALLFSLDGNGSLPIVAKLLGRNPKAIKSVIRISTFVSALVIIVFTFTISGISGSHTSPDALTGVHNMMDGVIVFALIFGIFSMITSFFGVAESIKETLNWDIGVNKKLSWFLAVSVPYSLYVFGIENLSSVINFVGSIGGGVCAIILIIIFKKIKDSKKELLLFSHRPKNPVLYFLVVLFVLGLLYNLWYYFSI